MNRLGNNSPTKSESTIIENKVSKIKRWFLTNYGINSYGNNFFNNYLYRCNFDEEMCKQKIKNYFRNKKLHPEYFQAGDMNEEKFRVFCSSIYSLYMPKLNSNGYRIFIDRVTNDENLFDIFKIMKYYCMQTDLLYLEEGYDNGDVILFDCNNTKLLNLIAFTPFFVKSLILLLEMYPLRIKLLVLINTGQVMEICVKMMKKTFLKKFHDLIYAYSGGHEFFLKHCDCDVLPEDYNGDLPSLDHIRSKWMERLDQYRDWFVEVNHKVENSCNVEWNTENVFGYNGSFNHLQVD